MDKYGTEFYDWIRKHRNDDPTSLRLKYHGKDEWTADAITHIECLRKAGNKFCCRYSQAWIPELMLSPLSVEQATSGNVAWLHRLIAGDTENGPRRVLDMTCGMGIDAAYLSWMPETRLTALDLNPTAATAAMHNFRNAPNVEIINGDSVEYLTRSNETFDIIFIDPARRGDAGQRVYNVHDCTPDVTVLIPLMLSKGRQILIKLSPMLDVIQTLRDLPSTTCLHIIDDNGECRELLAETDTRHYTGEPLIKAWNNGIPFTFTRSEESETPISAYRIPAAGDFLFEPSPAIMKAAPFKLLAQRFDMQKLHQFTHLYVSDRYTSMFPGKGYEIMEVIPFSSSAMRHFAARYPKIDVATRNFGISTEELRKRLRVKQGDGDIRVIGATCADSSRYLIVAKSFRYAEE